ncbi:translation initiation factor IF-2-like [Sorex fumeus]|uniref:translation initiation factor IF-2-like n=1 Tax=Sorex fumeus TaxID=62283 RepID=UPI0024AD0968|nr:translation initiation factor IF-2-like [Sorex fumeus]
MHGSEKLPGGARGEREAPGRRPGDCGPPRPLQPLPPPPPPRLHHPSSGHPHRSHRRCRCWGWGHGSRFILHGAAAAAGRGRKEGGAGRRSARRKGGGGGGRRHCAGACAARAPARRAGGGRGAGRPGREEREESEGRKRRGRAVRTAHTARRAFERVAAPGRLSAAGCPGLCLMAQRGQGRGAGLGRPDLEDAGSGKEDAALPVPYFLTRRIYTPEPAEHRPADLPAQASEQGAGPMVVTVLQMQTVNGEKEEGTYVVKFETGEN